MKIHINQAPSRYYSTGDYFKRIPGYEFVDNDADIAIHFNQPNGVRADKHIYYDRDPGRTHLVPQGEYTYYTQYGDWPDDRVVLHATAPDIFKPGNPKYDVVFAGRMYAFREPWIETIKKSGIDIACFGDGVSTEEYAERLSEGRVILNYSERGEINRRVFEGMAIGTMVADRVAHLEDVGNDGEHYYTFDRDNPDTVVEAIHRALDMPLNTRDHIIKHHTYKHRLQELLRKEQL